MIFSACGFYLQQRDCLKSPMEHGIPHMTGWWRIKYSISPDCSHDSHIKFSIILFDGKKKHAEIAPLEV